MSTVKLLITILQLLCGLGIIAMVLFQSGKSAGLSGAIGGVADSYLSKGKAKTMDAKLARATKWVGGIFLVLTLVLSPAAITEKPSFPGGLFSCLFPLSKKFFKIFGTIVAISEIVWYTISITQVPLTFYRWGAGLEALLWQN